MITQTHWCPYTMSDLQPTHWFWEGNVQAKVVVWLKRSGWTILAVADTAKRQRGVDILARRGRELLAVEVKGRPTTYYARGEKAGQEKPTQPATQARQWYAHALLSLMMSRDRIRYTYVALAIPDYPTYEALVSRTRCSLEILGVTVLIVHESGAIDVAVSPIEAWP